MAKHHSVNGAPATGAVAMYDVKQTLVAAGWTVIGSGDGLALYSAAGDIITTGASGAGGLGNANAWFAIRDANTRVGFTFQRTTTDVLWRVKYTETGAFGGGTPGISQTGTAADEQVLFGAGTDASPTGTQMLHTNGAYRFHVVANSAAQTGNNTYPFWFGCTVNATGVCASLFMLEGMQDGTFNALDQAPRVITAWYVAGGPATSGLQSPSSSGLYTRGWVRYGLGTPTFHKFALAGYMPSQSTSYDVSLPTVPSGGSMTSAYETADIPLPLACMRITIHSGGDYHVKGFLADTKINTQFGRAYPSTILNATNAYVYYGGMLLSWPESVSPSL